MHGTSSDTLLIFKFMWRHETLTSCSVVCTRQGDELIENAIQTYLMFVNASGDVAKD